jgi:S1-C subfamily serine protease
MNVLLSFGQRKEESKVYVFPYKYSKVMKNQDESAGVFVNGTQLTGVNTDQIIEYTTFSSGKLYVGIRYFDAYRTIGVDVDGSEPTCVGIIVDSEPSFMGVRYSLSLVQVSFDTMMMQLAKIKGGYSKKDFDENDIALQVNGKSIGKPVTDGNGTGFFITSTGLIITNHHVIENASKIFVRGINGNLNEKWEAEIIAMDDTNDLAILNIKDTTFTPTLSFAVRANAVETGEDVFALGYPMTTSLGKEIKLTNGIISAESGYKDDNTSFQISAPVQKGNSGSPVFDKGGNLVGVITSKVHSAENVAYAVKNDALDRLLTKVVDPSTLNQVNSLEGLPLNEQVKKIRKGVLLIEISKKFIDK